MLILCSCDRILVGNTTQNHLFECGDVIESPVATECEAASKNFRRPFQFCSARSVVEGREIFKGATVLKRRRSEKFPFQ